MLESDSGGCQYIQWNLAIWLLLSTAWQKEVLGHYAEQSCRTQVCKLEHCTNLNDEALLQDWINDWINVLVQIFKQEWEAILDSHLQVLQEVAVIEGFHPALQLLAFPLFDPVHCLQANT